MRKVNYKSDFDFVMRLKDSSGKEVPFPECDWDAEFWTSSKQNAYRASCIGGEYVNCFREADGSIHFVFNCHRMGKGVLKWEPHFCFPNGMYPDGIQDQFRKAQLDIELVDGDGDDVADTPDVEVYMPAVYLTAYDLAVRNGYTGTYEDYVAYTNRFPQVVETAEAVNSLLSDFADGKAMIADALTRQGADTSASESMQSMADKVLGLQLAVEGDPQYVEHDSRVGGYDLYNVMHNHRKAEFPYMYAVSFNAPTVTLSGADAYLCSDGYFTEESGTHKMPFAQEHYVIYYFRNRSFTLTATAARYINEMCVYNGVPIVHFSNVEVRRLAIYGDEPFSTDNINAFNIRRGHIDDIAIESMESGYLVIDNIGVVSLRMPNFKVLKGGTIFSALNNIQSAMFPALATMSGGTIAYNCGNLAELSLPALATMSGGTIAYNCGNLAELSLPALTTVSNGTVVYNANALAELSLPALATISSATESGGTVVDHANALAELSLPALTTVSNGTIARYCDNLAELSLPALATVSGGTIVGYCAALAELSLPALEDVYTTKQFNVLWGCDNVSKVLLPRAKRFAPTGARETNRLIVDKSSQHVTFELPVCELFSASFRDGRTANTLCELIFGVAINTIYTSCSNTQTLIIKIGKGAVTFVDSANANWDTEALKQFIADLGDNTDGEVKQIRIGTSQIAKLSEEDIALAVAKNYSLS